MAKRNSALDPEVVGLLRELSEHAPEVFFGDRDTSLQGDLLNRGRVPRPASVIARAVEQSLDETARRRAGEILRAAGTELLVSSQSASGRIIPSGDRDGRSPAFQRPRSAGPDLSRRAAGDPRLASWFGDDNEIVIAFFAGSEAQGIERSLRLLDRALRLAPSDVIRNSYAVGLQLAGQPRASLSILRTLSKRVESPSLQVLLRENIGMGLSSLGDHTRAAENYAALSRLDPCCMYSASSWLLNAIQAGNLQSATEAVGILQEAPVAAHEQLRSAVKAQHDSRLAGKWAPTPAANETLAALESRLDPLSRTVADAIH